MNPVGTLAEQIVKYHFPDDEDAAVCFVSGWLDANIGKLNGYTHEEFSITGSGVFSPEIQPVEKAIFTLLYEIDYYDRKIRKVLRDSIATSGVGEWSMIREGDTIIQRTSKHLISREWKGYRDAANDQLKDLLAKYDIYKAVPVQVAGADGVTYIIS